MTGEITLRGRVLPIGGLKEKTMAAYAAGVRTVLIPADNMGDLDEIDPTIRESLRFVPCHHASDVLKEALVAEDHATISVVPSLHKEEKSTGEERVTPTAGPRSGNRPRCR